MSWERQSECDRIVAHGDLGAEMRTANGLRVTIAALVVVFESNSARAAPPAEPCFDIVEPSAKSELFVPIRVNRCTGETWILLRQPVVDPHGKALGVFTYIWHPIQIASDPPAFVGTPNQIDAVPE